MSPYIGEICYSQVQKKGPFFYDHHLYKAMFIKSAAQNCVHLFMALWVSISTQNCFLLSLFISVYASEVKWSKHL